MLPTDTWHQQEADWRIAAVTRIETSLEGCACHDLGHALINPK